MDSKQFDTLTRSLSSRRSALTGVLGGVAALLGLPGPEDAGAHNPIPACKKFADPKQRAKCLRRARAHNRNRHTCRPKPLAVTCAGQCGGIRANNCGKLVNCPGCGEGKRCLINGGCSRICAADDPCPTGCACGLATREGGLNCVPSSVAEAQCEQFPQVCTSTAECPVGQFCSGVIASCDDTSRCFPVCPV